MVERDRVEIDDFERPLGLRGSQRPRCGPCAGQIGRARLGGLFRFGRALRDLVRLGFVLVGSLGAVGFFGAARDLTLALFLFTQALGFFLSLAARLSRFGFGVVVGQFLKC